MSNEDQIAEILANWQDARLRGEASDMEALFATHPELAEELRARFRALQLIELAQAPVEAPLPAMPETIGEYRILRELGRGGMGVVYEAEQLALRRRVALKVLFPALGRPVGAIERFKREARAAARLNHTNILSVHSLGEENGAWYYAMDLVSGTSLDRVLDMTRALQGGHPALEATPEEHRAATASGLLGTDQSVRVRYARIAEVLSGIADALHVAHEAGVVHRDIKPANLLLDQDGELHITDFGVARLMETGGGMTRTGDVVGTPAYMSPEQARGRSDLVDRRTDVYSLGATLYEVVALRPPFEDQEIGELYRKILTQEPRAPRAISTEIPRDLETIIQKAMQKAPEDRYPTARDMARDLRAFSEDRSITARRIPVWRRAWRGAKRHRGITTAAMIALLAAIGAVWAFARAASESAQRSGMEYEQLLGRIDDAVATRGGDRDTIALIDEAIALRPDRPEGYFHRAQVLERSVQDRLADIDAAEVRGHPPQIAHEVRAAIYGEARRFDEMWAEQDALRALPSDGSPSMLEATDAMRRGDYEGALAVLGRLIASGAPADAHVRRARLARLRLQEAHGDFEEAMLDAVALLAVPDPVRDLANEVRLVALWWKLDRKDEADRRFEALLERASTASERAALAFVEEVPQQEEYVKRALRATEQHRARAWHLAERARMAFVHDRDEEAATLLAAEALAADPDDPYALRMHAIALREAEDLRGAKDALRRALEQAPDSIMAAATLTAFLINDGEGDEAIRVADRVVASGTARQAWSALWLRARGEIARGAFETAEATLDAAVALCPHAAAHAFERARLYSVQGRFTKSLALLESIDLASPIEISGRIQDPFEIHLLRASVLGSLGRPNEALAALEAAEEDAQRQGVDLGPLKAYALNNAGRYADALRVSREALEKRPDDLPSAYTAAYALTHLGRPAEAEAMLRPIFDAGAARHPHYQLRSQLRLRRSDGRGALDDADAGLRLSPDNSVLLLYRSQALSVLGEEEAARETFASVHARCSSHPLYAETAFVHLQMLGVLGYAEEALAILEEVVPSLPPAMDAKVRTDRVRLLWLAGKLEEAIAACRDLRRAHPGDIDASVLLTYLGSFVQPDAVADAILSALEAGPVAYGGWMLLAAHRAGLTEHALRITDARYPEPPIQLLQGLLPALRSVGRHADAKALASSAMSSDPRPAERLIGAYFAAVAGEDERARELLAIAGSGWSAVPSFDRARIHAVLGEKNEALTWLTRALEKGYPRINLIDPEIQLLAGHAGFEKLQAEDAAD